MAGQKTVETDADVDAFLASIEDGKRRDDAHRLVEMMQRITSEPPRLWGNMVGFGRYHYRYESGHEGDAFLTGFAPRKSEFTLYLNCIFLPDRKEQSDALLARLGKHRMGRACLYLRRLDDIDLEILGELIRISVEGLKDLYPSAR